MPSQPATALHRAAARLVRDYARARIPLPLPATANDLAASLPSRLAALRSAVAPAADLDAGFRVLRGLQVRLDFLAATEPRTRAALARWAALEERAGHFSSSSDPPLSQARAFAAGAALLPRVARPPVLVTASTGGGGAGDAPTAGPWAVEEAGACGPPGDEEDEAGHAAAAAAAEAAVDALAAAAAGGGGSVSDATAPPAARVMALAAALHSGGGGGLRAAPVEWLYAGLAPLLPGPVAAARRGAPLGVAAVAAGVVARLGIPAIPAGVVVGGGGPADSASAAAALARSLPPDRAARLAGRAASLASAPPGASDAWLLVCPDGTWAWDPSTGRVETGENGSDDDGSSGLAALAARAAAGVGASPPSPSIRLSLGARRAWVALLRTAVVAHTRRGDAEAVAGVLPQVLALDGDAEEWGMVLPPGAAG